MFQDCDKLSSLNISGWDTSKVSSINSLFYNCGKLTHIRLDNSDVDTVNDIISVLLTRKTIGKIYVTGIEDVSGIDKATAASKKWKIVIKENRMNSFIPINLGGKSIRAIYTNNETYL
jgi:surface protein